MLTFSQLLAAAIALFDQQEYEEAAELASEGLAQFPDEGRLLELYGACQANLRDFSSAREALERASLLVPLHPLAQMALARAYAALQQSELALVIYRHLLTRERCPTNLLPTVIKDVAALGKHRLALKACRMLARREPANPRAHFGVAYYLGRLKAGPGSILRPLSLAHDLAPDEPPYRVNLGFVLAEAGRYDEASSMLAGLNLRQIACPCWLKRMAHIFTASGDDERAAACLVRLVRLTSREHIEVEDVEP